MTSAGGAEETPVIDNRPLRMLYWRTLGVGAFTALVVSLKISLLWGGVFAIGVLVGTLNWFCLGCLLLALTKRNIVGAFGWMTGKVALLGAMMFLVLPVASVRIGAFLLGFSLFLLMAALEAGGMVLRSAMKSAEGPDARPLPRNLNELFTGKASNG